MRMLDAKLVDQRFLFLGAGEAGIGVANLLVTAMQADGLDEAEARRRCWFVDSRGLVVAGRDHLNEEKLRFAHDHPPVAGLLEAVEALRPHAIIGVSGSPGTFDRPVLERMAEINERPVVLALSNPTSKSECTAREAYEWTGGRAIFASGSPFEPVELDGRRFVPGQANNALIFPAVGLGAIESEAAEITDDMFFIAARTLADQVTDDDLAVGRLYPALDRIRDVSATIATAVAELAWREGLARRPRPDDPGTAIRASMFDPRYP